VFFKFLKKYKSNLIFGVFILLLIIPQTRMPIQVFLQRIIAFSPSTISEDKRVSLADFSWNLREVNGMSANLNASKEKVILINLWATWCPPCVAEMPSLQALYDDYGDRVDFYFVSNEKSETITKFLDKHNYNFPVYQSLQSPPSVLQSNALPTTYLIDKKGTILINKTGAADWNSKKMKALLDRLLSEEN